MRPALRSEVLYARGVDNGATPPERPSSRPLPATKARVVEPVDPRVESSSGAGRANGNGSGSKGKAGGGGNGSNGNGSGAGHRAGAGSARRQSPPPRPPKRREVTSAAADVSSLAVAVPESRHPKPPPSEPDREVVAGAAQPPAPAKAVEVSMSLAPPLAPPAVPEASDATAPVLLPPIMPAEPEPPARSRPFARRADRAQRDTGQHTAVAVPVVYDAEADATVETDASERPDGVTALGPKPVRTPVLVYRRKTRPRVRRVTRVVRHVDTWSVFKVALVFNAFMYAVVLTSGVLLWHVADATGTIDNVEKFFEGVGWEHFQLKAGEIYHNAWIGGLFVAIGLTGLAVLMATLFNLITDLVGGVRVSVLEEEVVTRPNRHAISDPTAVEVGGPVQPG